MKSRTRIVNSENVRFGFLAVGLKFKDQVLHMVDIFTDVILARDLYNMSRNDPDIKKGDFQYDYNKSFVIVSLAIFGPYII